MNAQKPMDADHTLSIIVPALNVETRLEDAVAIMCRAAARWFADYEILVFDDGSTDRTGALADRLAQANPHIRVIHNPSPTGLGGVIRAGVNAARLRYVTRVHGSGTETDETLDAIFALAGKADLVIPYVPDMSRRPRFRRVLSQAFTQLMNALFGLNLRYYNQSILCRTDLARRIRVRTSSHAYPAEFVIKALKAGYGYCEVGVVSLSESTGLRSTALKPRNVLGVARFLATTLWDVYADGCRARWRRLRGGRS